MHSIIRFRVSLKSFVVVALLGFWAFPSVTFAQSEPAVSEETTGGKGVNFGISYPLSTRGFQAGKYTNIFSLNGAVGISRAERGVAIAGVTSVIREDARGWQIAGFSNHIGQSVRGTSIAGVLNTYSSGKGFQLAGFGNLARKDQHGFQLAGFINKANQVNGMQMAGFINVAKTVKGVQFGVVNVADSNDYPIGIVNLVKGGEKSIGISTDETLTSVVSFRSGGRVLYGILGVGYNLTSDVDQYVMEGGIGAHAINKGIFRLNTELVSIGMTNFEDGEYSRFAFRLLPALRLANRIEVFAGPTFNYSNADSDIHRKLSTRDVWRRTRGQNIQELYVGLTGGVNLKLN